MTWNPSSSDDDKKVYLARVGAKKTNIKWQTTAKTRSRLCLHRFTVNDGTRDTGALKHITSRLRRIWLMKPSSPRSQNTENYFFIEFSLVFSHPSVKNFCQSLFGKSLVISLLFMKLYFIDFFSSSLPAPSFSLVYRILLLVSPFYASARLSWVARCAGSGCCVE